MANLLAEETTVPMENRWLIPSHWWLSHIPLWNAINAFIHYFSLKKKKLKENANGMPLMHLFTISL